MTVPAAQTVPLDDVFRSHKVAENLSSLATLGESYVLNAPLGRKPCCAWDAGSLSRVPRGVHVQEHLCLLMDMGGTHTKVGYRDASGTWTPILDHHNDWFESKRDPALPLLQAFFRTLLSETVNACPLLTTTPLPIRLGVIWSNQVKTKRFDTGRTRGVTGLVHGFQSGGYRKGEWFLKGIKNGDDIGEVLLNECERLSLSPEVMILGNDTLFTLFAVKGAHAGVVMSSGGNCTLVGVTTEDKDELYNSELGGMFMLPENVLSAADYAFMKTRAISSLSLEELSAGTWFPAMVAAHIAQAATTPEGSTLKQVTSDIASKELVITNRALSGLLRGTETIFSSYPEPIRATLQTLVSSLVDRGATLAGLLCYLSVINQVKAGLRHAVVSLDSSMARHFPGYLDGIKRTCSALVPTGITIEICLLSPIQLKEGLEISVPLQGAAAALANN
jgi:hypothetical protein